jgi:hypothetical protein
MMKRFKKLVFAGAVVLVAAAVSATAMAAAGSPSEIIAGLTGRSPDSVVEERLDSGKTYGEIAGDAGVLDEFKVQMLERKKSLLAERVAEGTLTQEQADAIIAEMEENMANCDGAGSGAGTCGAGFGGMGGQGRGNGGKGNGRGIGGCAGTGSAS